MVYPEEGMRGMVAAAEDGFLPEFDIQFLKDGTPVLCHDSTVDRTMTGATGSIKSLTLEQWRSARIKPVYEGGKDDRPLTLEEALDYLGGRIVLVAEVKPGATADEADTVIEMVKERGLDKAVLMQSFDFATAKQIAAAGLEVVFLCGKTSGQSWTAIKNAGINYLGPSRSMSAADMNAAAAAGLKVVPYTMTKRSHVTGLPPSVFGYFSNDPWENSGRMPQRSTPAWATGDGWPARRNYAKDSYAADVLDLHDLVVTGGNLYVPYTRGQGGGTVVNLRSISIEHVTGGPIEPPYTIYAKLLMGRSNYNQGDNVGFTLYRNDSNPEASFLDNAKPGQQGYTFAVRRDGRVQGWAYIDGAKASLIATNDEEAAPEVFVEAGKQRVVEVALDVTEELGIQWSNLTTGETVVSAEIPVKGPLIPMIRAKRQDVTVLDLAIYAALPEV